MDHCSKYPSFFLNWINLKSSAPLVFLGYHKFSMFLTAWHYFLVPLSHFLQTFNTSGDPQNRWSWSQLANYSHLSLLCYAKYLLLISVLPSKSQRIFPLFWDFFPYSFNRMSSRSSNSAPLIYLFLSTFNVSILHWFPSLSLNTNTTSSYFKKPAHNQSYHRLQCTYSEPSVYF